MGFHWQHLSATLDRAESIQQFPEVWDAPPKQLTNAGRADSIPSSFFLSFWLSCFLAFLLSCFLSVWFWNEMIVSNSHGINQSIRDRKKGGKKLREKWRMAATNWRRWKQFSSF